METNILQWWNMWYSGHLRLCSNALVLLGKFGKQNTSSGWGCDWLHLARHEKKEVITGKNWIACKQIWKGFRTRKCKNKTEKFLYKMALVQNPFRWFHGFPGGSTDKESACNVGDLGFGTWIKKIPLRKGMWGLGHPLQYFGLENAVHCIVHGVAKIGHGWVTFTWPRPDKRAMTSHQAWCFQCSFHHGERDRGRDWE